jgi:uncharacterized protein (TIGR03437 family)
MDAHVANFDRDNSSAATAGELISVYATGLGAVQAPMGSGFAASGADSITDNITVSIGGQPAQVQYAGLAPFFVGLYQINVIVPAGLASGDQPMVVTMDGVSSSSQVTVSVR